MREAVVDASVVLEWFVRIPDRRRTAARRLRQEYEAGDLLVLAPPLLYLEVLNVAGRRWSWSEEDLLVLAGALEELRFELIEPELDRVATWVAQGLTAYDAAYVALAEAANTYLLTDDETVLRLAGGVARPPG